MRVELTAVRNELARAERLRGTRRNEALSALSTRIGNSQQGSGDQAKARLLVTAVNELANVR